MRTTWSRRWSCCAGAALILAGALPALAADAQSEARKLFDEAVQHLEVQDYAGAAELFEAAYTRVPRSIILLNLGGVYRQLGRLADAANAFQGYIEHPHADPEHVPEVERLLAELDAGLGRMRLAVEGSFEQVRIDGKLLPRERVAKPTRLKPGRHEVVVVRRAAGPDQTQTATLHPGKLTVLRFTAPKASETTAAPLAGSAGDRATGPSAQAWAGWITAGVGLLGGVVVTSVFAVRASEKDAEADQYCAGGLCYGDGVRLGAEAHDAAAVATVGAVVGAALVTSGVVLVLTAPDAGDEPAVGLALRPMASDATAGLGLWGAW